jgi:hypothetical protein
MSLQTLNLVDASLLPCFGSSAALFGTGTTVFVDMGLHCLFGVASGVNYVARRDVSVVCRCFVAPSLVMLGSFLMMMRSMREVF